jgi:chemotaxis signal transduction protein
MTASELHAPTKAPRTALALECAVGRARVAIPVDFVDSIIEYEVTGPLPLSRAWIGGVGFHEQRMLLSVALSSPKAQTPMRVRAVKGVLLHAPGSELAWALEVASVASFVRLTILERRANTAAGALPSWITGAKTTEDERTIAWLSVDAMVLDLAGSQSRAEERHGT